MQGRAQGHLGPPARPPSPGTAGVLGCLPDTSPSDLQFPVTHHTPVQSTGVSETVANAWTPAPRPRPDSPPHAGFGASVGDAKRKCVVHPEESRRPGGVACHSEAEALTRTRALRQGAPAGPPRQLPAGGFLRVSESPATFGCLSREGRGRDGTRSGGRLGRARGDGVASSRRDDWPRAAWGWTRGAASLPARALPGPPPASLSSLSSPT